MPHESGHPAEQPTGNVPSDGVAAEHPGVEEVVERLDRLWSDAPTRAPIPPPDMTGYQVGRYTIERIIGRGAFGIVYKARDRQLNRDVALKIPRPEVLEDDEKLRRFESEAKAAAGLDHPAIVPVHEAVLDGATPYIASAYFPGPNLAQWIKSNAASCAWQEAAHFIAQLAAAVQYAHEQGVVHRDLKPSNVLLVPKGDSTRRPQSLGDCQPRLTDFGLAKLAQSNLDDTRSSLLLGTPLYMAPEQLGHAAPADNSAAADVYALGVMLFELLTGGLPIDGATYVQVVDRLRETPPKRLRRLRPDLPKELDAICAKCLEKDPAARYASASELADDLNSHLRGEPVSVRRASLWDRLRYWCGQPQRIRDAGWYALCLHIWFTLWLSVQAVALPSFGFLSRGEYLSTLVEVAQVLAIIHVPMIVVGWQTLHGRHWALWVGLVIAFIGALWTFLVMIDVIPVFPFVYRDARYHAFSGSLLICGAMTLQFLLYAVALFARRKQSP